MDEMNADVVFLFEVLRHMLCAIDGAVLPTGAAEGDLKMITAIPFVLFY